MFLGACVPSLSCSSAGHTGDKFLTSVSRSRCATPPLGAVRCALRPRPCALVARVSSRSLSASYHRVALRWRSSVVGAARRRARATCSRESRATGNTPQSDGPHNDDDDEHHTGKRRARRGRRARRDGMGRDGRGGASSAPGRATGEQRARVEATPRCQRDSLAVTRRCHAGADEQLYLWMSQTDRQTDRPHARATRPRPSREKFR